MKTKFEVLSAQIDDALESIQVHLSMVRSGSYPKFKDQEIFFRVIRREGDKLTKASRELARMLCEQSKVLANARAQAHSLEVRSRTDGRLPDVRVLLTPVDED